MAIGAIIKTIDRVEMEEDLSIRDIPAITGTTGKERIIECVGCTAIGFLLTKLLSLRCTGNKGKDLPLLIFIQCLSTIRHTSAYVQWIVTITEGMYKSIS